MKCTIIFLGIIAFLGNLNAEERPEAEALHILDSFMLAFNAGDVDAIAQLFHYPHIRIAGDISVWDLPEEFKADRDSASREQFKKVTGWHHSAWDSREVVQSSDVKIHFAVQFTRYRQDDSVIGTYNSLWIVTKHDGRWGIQARSSFAPSPNLPN